jgi:hypothetical protein
MGSKKSNLQGIRRDDEECSPSGSGVEAAEMVGNLSGARDQHASNPALLRPVELTSDDKKRAHSQMVDLPMISVLLKSTAEYRIRNIC